jgi:hypothetical protein
MDTETTYQISLFYQHNIGYDDYNKYTDTVVDSLHTLATIFLVLGSNFFLKISIGILIDLILVSVGGIKFKSSATAGGNVVVTQGQQPGAQVELQQMNSSSQQQVSSQQHQYAVDAPPPSKVLSLESLALHLDIPTLMDCKNLESALAMDVNELKEKVGISYEEFMRLKKYKAGLKNLSVH